MGNQLSHRTHRVVVKTAMEAGGCGYDFCAAQTACVKKNKSPAQLQECMTKTAALTKCMQGNELYFRHYMQMMNNGLDEDEGKQMRNRHPDDRWRWRWWTGMIRIPPPPAASKKTFQY